MHFKMSLFYHIKDSLLCFIINMVQVRMFISHMAVKVELLELSEPTEAEQAQDLLPQVVAEVAIGPNLLKRSTIFNTRGRRRVVSWINFPIACGNHNLMVEKIISLNGRSLGSRLVYKLTTE